MCLFRQNESGTKVGRYSKIAVFVLPLATTALLLLAFGEAVASPAAPQPWTGPVPRAVCGPGDKPETGLQGEVTLADRDGKPRSLSEWNGKPQVINFWATWCAPCRREIPMLNALAADPAFAGFALIGIAIDFRENASHGHPPWRFRLRALVGWHGHRTRVQLRNRHVQAWA